MKDRFCRLCLALLSFCLILSCHQATKQTEELALVTAVFPSADTLPENLLRIYIQFSKPMKTIGNLEKIRLLDQDTGEEVEAFFNNVFELWDKEQRQLTILFDPARVKTGLKANEDLGRALKPGGRYKLVIEGLEDINHNPLKEIFIKEFIVKDADYSSPNIASWTIKSPLIGTRTPFVVQFPAMLDQLSLRQRLLITDAKKEAISGKIEIAKQEKEWRFIPDQVWQAGSYSLFINARLEDPAGNNLNGLFDHQIGSLRFQEEGEILELSFQVEAAQ